MLRKDIKEIEGTYKIYLSHADRLLHAYFEGNPDELHLDLWCFEDEDTEKHDDQPLLSFTINLRTATIQP